MAFNSVGYISCKLVNATPVLNTLPKSSNLTFFKNSELDNLYNFALSSKPYVENTTLFTSGLSFNKPNNGF